MKISKEGSILLQFVPAAGVRQYDWSKKQVRHKRHQFTGFCCVIICSPFEFSVNKMSNPVSLL